MSDRVDNAQRPGERTMTDSGVSKGTLLVAAGVLDKWGDKRLAHDVAQAGDEIEGLRVTVGCQHDLIVRPDLHLRGCEGDWTLQACTRCSTIAAELFGVTT